MKASHQKYGAFGLFVLLFGCMLLNCSDSKDPVQPTNHPPSKPSNPTPADSTVASIFANLSWESSDPDGDPVKFDCYFGTVASPPLHASNHAAKILDLDTLQYGQNYFWKIVAKDNSGNKSSGPVWMFTTVENSPPAAPSNPSPTNGATARPLSQQLGWSCTDPEGDPLVYDVYFDDVSDPTTRVGADVGTASFDPGTLDFSTTYYWKIVAKDDYANSTSGPVWSFTTGDNAPPSPPSSPSPPSGSTNQSVTVEVSWSASTDPESDPVKYDIYWGTSTSPVKIDSNLVAITYNPGTLAYGQIYYWKVVAKDDHGNSTPGALWHFTTVANQAPSYPSNPSPASGSTGQPITTQLSWSPSTDPESDPVTYDVHFGTTSPPGVVSPDQSTSTYNPGTLDYSTTYYWQVVAKDDHGNSTPGTIWNFATSANTAPNAPSSPTPSHGASGQAVTTQLGWVCSDPESDPLTYDVYFGEQGDPPLASSNETSNSFSPQGLRFSRTYYWKIVAKDDHGNSTTGAIWSFSTTAGQWTQISTGYPDAYLGNIWGSSENNLFVVALEIDYITPAYLPKILKYNGSTWTETNFPQEKAPMDLWGFSASDIFAAGTNLWETISEASAYRYNGTNWLEMSIGTEPSMAGVWGSSASDVFLVGDFGTILHYNGMSWTSTALSGMSYGVLIDVWGSSSTDVYAVGFYRSGLSDYYGIIGHYNGATWSTVHTVMDDRLFGVWGSSDSNVFAVGRNGAILHYDGSGWGSVTSASFDISGIWGTAADDIFIVGEAGNIRHYNGTGWSSMTSGTVEGLADVWGTSSTNVYATGANGVFLRYGPP